MKVDPAKLEAEAQELMAQYKGEVPAPQEEETPQEVQLEVDPQAPEEPTETAQDPVEAPERRRARRIVRDGVSPKEG